MDKSSKLQEQLIALPGKGEILCGEPSLIMGGELQRHLVKTNVNIRMLRPVRDSFQVEADLFGG